MGGLAGLIILAAFLANAAHGERKSGQRQRQELALIAEIATRP